MTEQAKKNLELIKSKFIPAMYAVDKTIVNADAFVQKPNYVTNNDLDDYSIILFVAHKDGTGDYMYIPSNEPLSSYSFVECAGRMTKMFEQE